MTADLPGEGFEARLLPIADLVLGGDEALVEIPDRRLVPAIGRDAPGILDLLPRRARPVRGGARFEPPFSAAAE